MTTPGIPITEEWLQSVGFRWHQLDRQPHKQWLLWLGDGIVDAATGEHQGGTCHSDLGIELAPWTTRDRETQETVIEHWSCWLRADYAGRYSRFVHTRHMHFQEEVVRLVEALTGLPWEPANHLFQCVRMPVQAERMRQDSERLDRKMLLSDNKAGSWRDIEKDDTRGGALPEHMEDSIQNGTSR